MDFQTRITQLIKDEGVPDLAKRLGVSRQTVYHWKNGAVQPHLKHLQQVGGVVTFPEAEPVRPKIEDIAASIPGVTIGTVQERITVRDDYAQD